MTLASGDRLTGRNKVFFEATNLVLGGNITEVKFTKYTQFGNFR